MDEQQKQRCDEYLLQLKVFFDSDLLDEKAKTQAILLQDEDKLEKVKTYITERFTLHEWLECDKSLVLHALLESKKPNFLYFILTTTFIDLTIINLNSLSKNNHSLFVLLAKNELKSEELPFYQLVFILQTIFNQGYISVAQDFEYLKNVYFTPGLIERNREREYTWLLLRAYNKIQNKKNLEYLYDKASFNKLFTLISFKLKRNYGFRYSHQDKNILLKIANNCLTHYKENAHFFLKAMVHYGVHTVIATQDKKGTFNRLKADIYQNDIPQDLQFEALAIELFPELAHCSSPPAPVDIAQTDTDPDILQDTILSVPD